MGKWLCNCSSLADSSGVRCVNPLLPPPWFSLLSHSLCSAKGDVSLDPQTAHASVVLSENLKSVYFTDIPQELPHSSRRFTAYPCVLGSSAYSSGCHCWEAEVGDKTHWALGVCYVSASCHAEDPKQEMGYWRVRRWNEKYVAMTTPFTPLLLGVCECLLELSPTLTVGQDTELCGRLCSIMVLTWKNHCFPGESLVQVI